MNNRMLSKRIGFLILSLFLARAALANDVFLVGLQTKQLPTETVVSFVCNGVVKFATQEFENPHRLYVYLANTRQGPVPDVTRVHGGPVLKIEIKTYLQNPPVLAAVLYLRRKQPFQITQSGKTIAVHIQKEQANRLETQASLKNPENEISSILNVPGRISLNYHDAELPNVLRLLSKQNHINIVAGKDVVGKVTVSLQNVSLREALDNILKANGFDYMVEGNVVLVKKMDTNLPGELVTKIFRLKYVDAENVKKTLEHVKSKNGSIEVFDNYFDANTVQSKQRTPGNLKKTQVVARGGHSSVLIVTDRPEIVRQIGDLIAQLDVEAPQIMIESKLVEMAPLHEDKLGIDWDKTISASLFWQQMLPGGKAQSYSAMVENPRAGQWTLGHLSASQFGMVLDFLKEKTDAKLISNPRITTTDDKEAVISVGTTVPIPQINRGVGGQGDIVTFNYKDVNIELRVTPHVSEGDQIVMTVNPVIEEITGEVVVDVNRAPITSKRAVHTTVTVRDGETVVIGGMIKDNTTVKTSRVWLLGDLPLVGAAFRHKTREKKQTDLMIFITPHIVKSE